MLSAGRSSRPQGAARADVGEVDRDIEIAAVVVVVQPVQILVVVQSLSSAPAASIHHWSRRLPTTGSQA